MKKHFSSFWFQGLLLIFTVQAGSPALRAEEQTKTSPTSLSLDNPWVLGSLVVGSVALVATQDTAIKKGMPSFLNSDFAETFDLHGLGRQGSFFEVMGGPVGALGTAGAFYITGLVTDSARERRVAILIPETFILNGVIVQVSKELIGRERPMSTDKPFHIRPLSGEDSFPSGHTSSAFAVATVISDQYHSLWVSGLSYGTASLVGVGRLIQGKHWASDVVAGAFLGIASGKLTEHFDNKLGWSVSLATNGKGLSVNKSF